VLVHPLAQEGRVVPAAHAGSGEGGNEGRLTWQRYAS
jgi:hypothetical protein